MHAVEYEYQHYFRHTFQYINYKNIIIDTLLILLGTFLWKESPFDVPTVCGSASCTGILTTEHCHHYNSKMKWL